MSDNQPAQQIESPYDPQPPTGERLAVDSNWPTIVSNRWSPWLALVGVGLICLWADFAVSPLMDEFSQNELGAVWVYLCLGIIPAQIGMLALWLCWSVSPFARRLVIYWAANFVAGAAVLAGISIGEGRGEIDELGRIIPLSLPLLVLSVQAPLWLVRQVLGWRLVRNEREIAPSAEPPLRIRDLMVTTLLVAVSLAAARVAPSSAPNVQHWANWGIVLASCGGVSLIALLPVSAWFLRQRIMLIGIVLTAVYAALAVAVTWIVIYVVDRNFWRNWWEMVGLGIMIVSFAAALALAALAARAAGYRLEFGRSAGSPEHHSQR